MKIGILKKHVAIQMHHNVSPGDMFHILMREPWVSCNLPFLCMLDDAADDVYCHERLEVHLVPSKAFKRMLHFDSAFSELIEQHVMSCS